MIKTLLRNSGLCGFREAVHTVRGCHVEPSVGQGCDSCMLRSVFPLYCLPTDAPKLCLVMFGLLQTSLRFPDLEHARSSPQMQTYSVNRINSWISLHIFLLLDTIP